METKNELIMILSEEFGDSAVLTRKEIINCLDSKGVLEPVASAGAMTRFLGQSGFEKVGYGKYQLPTIGGSKKTTKVAKIKKSVVTKTVKVDNEPKEAAVNLMVNTETQNLIPSHFEGFVSWGHCPTIKKVIQSKMFYPVFITGLSGNGKTLMVEELHAQLKRELIRVNITIETDEDDLLGGFRLINGETKFVPGPVIQAMERGCTLLLDECDLGSNKLLALQPVLEGKGVFLKKINKWITPKAGFNVIATANTKGKGSDDGRFIGTNVLNEAFLERFKVTFEQEYPVQSVEKKILVNNLESLKGSVSVDDKKMVEDLTMWSGAIRKTFEEGGIDEIISTRRLVHIVETYSIFDDVSKAIELCTNRFDDETKASFVDLFAKISGDDQIAPEVEEEIEPF